MYQKKEIHAGLEEMKSVPKALLVDVRNPAEYNGGHIPGSINFAMSRILQEAEEAFPDKAQPLYVYCQSGARSGQATSMIKEMGYKNVKNIGGVNRYKGKLVR